MINIGSKRLGFAVHNFNQIAARPARRGSSFPRGSLTRARILCGHAVLMIGNFLMGSTEGTKFQKFPVRNFLLLLSILLINLGKKSRFIEAFGLAIHSLLLPGPRGRPRLGARGG